MPHKGQSSSEADSNHSHLNSSIPLPPQPFVFITSTESSWNGRPPSDARKIVRKHVITKYHSLKRSLPSREAPWTSLSIDGPMSCHFRRFRLDGHDSRGRKRLPDMEPESKEGHRGVEATQILRLSEILPRNIRSKNFVDPFGATALQLDRRKQEFIQHCTGETSPLWDR
jgi:hypothetical protein